MDRTPGRDYIQPDVTKVGGISEETGLPNTPMIIPYTVHG